MAKARLQPSSIEVEGGLRWYPIQTKPKQEGHVERRLKDLELEVFLPRIRMRRRVGTRVRWIFEPLFPGYLFCRLDLRFSGKLARYAPGVKDFVKFGSRVAELGEDVIGALQEKCPGGVAEIARSYQPGQLVIIKEGPLSGLEAIFEKEMRGNERVAVLLELLGRQTRLILSTDIIDRV